MYGLGLFFTLKLQTFWYDVAHLAMVIYLCAKFHGLILSGWWVMRVEPKKKEKKKEKMKNYCR